MSDILGVLGAAFSYDFLVRAIVAGTLVSACASLLGVSLVLKRYSMIGDGLSHVGFGALAAAGALGLAPLTAAIPVVVAAAFLLLRLRSPAGIKGDAAIALISVSSLAAGVLIISVSRGGNTDLYNYLFGSILALSRSDMYLSISLSAAASLLFVLFYNKIFAVTFDRDFAGAAGLNAGMYNTLIAVLTAVTIVPGMRMMGALLISSLIIFPPLTSMRLFKTFKSVTVSSVCVSVICFFTGIMASYLYSTPAGASIVMANIAAFALFSVIHAAVK